VIDRRTAVVVAVAAATGIVLARAAGAQHAPLPAAPATATTTSGPSASAGAAQTIAAPSAIPTHEEVEPDEPAAKTTAADNASEEPAKQQMQRPQVVVRDGMARLPGGRFVMGTANARAPSNERPARALVVAPFWIDRTEVTVGAYRACVERGGCVRPSRASAACTFDLGDAELPVSCVHWSDADTFCRAAGKRLPTESEWEYAARGTYSTPFPWGGIASCQAAATLVNDMSGKSCTARPARVGAHPTGASVFGLQDMTGNVEEWTSDWYVESLGRGPAPRAGAAHVLRGGGWLSPPSMSRTTTRNWGSAVEAGPNVGFRCARDDSP
jgi:formylglycine-generating enzyme required for sulfatase activity